MLRATTLSNILRCIEKASSLDADKMSNLFRTGKDKWILNIDDILQKDKQQQSNLSKEDELKLIE